MDNNKTCDDNSSIFYHGNMKIIWLPKHLFPEETYNPQEYLDKLPQWKIHKLKRRIYVLCKDLGLF